MTNHTLRRLLDALPVYALLLGVLTWAAPDRMQVAATLMYHGTLFDRVGWERSLSPDSRIDGVFSVTLTGTAPRVTGVALVLENTNGAMSWNTAAGSWGIGVVTGAADGPLVNAANGAVDVTAGRLYLLVSNAGQPGRFAAGAQFRVIVTTSTGTISSSPITLTDTPSPLPVPTPTRDDDKDGIANSVDRCLDTPAGATVEQSGMWIGCEPDTTGPTFVWQYPAKSGQPFAGYGLLTGRADDPSGVVGTALYLVNWPGRTGGDPVRLRAFFGNAVWQGWEARAVPPGDYTFRAEVVDARGNTTIVPDLTIAVAHTVAMPAPTPTPIPVPAPDIPAGSLRLLPATAAAPSGYVRVGELAGLGVLYVKQ